MPVCATCGTSYGSTVRICVRDGTPLVAGRADDPHLGSLLDGKYRIDSFISAGGMGSVYRAQHVMLGKTVAVKLIKSELVTSDEVVTRFQREARAASNLHHPNIVSVYDLGQTADGTLYIAMEFIDGPSLKDAIRKRGPMAPVEAIGILRQVASALSTAHRKQIVHRDLKSHNLMLASSDDGRTVAKLVDFGIAKTFDESTQLTAAGYMLGTPHYMSPEQAAGKPVDHRADLYSLGVILYEMLTGEVPFGDAALTSVLVRLATEIPATPSARRPDLRVPPALDGIAMRCLDKDPEKRFQSADEFSAALDLAVADIQNRHAASTAGVGAIPETLVRPADHRRSAAAPATRATVSTAGPPTGVGLPARMNRRFAGVLVALAVIAVVIAVGLGLPGDPAQDVSSSDTVQQPATAPPAPAPQSLDPAGTPPPPPPVAAAAPSVSAATANPVSEASVPPDPRPRPPTPADNAREPALSTSQPVATPTPPAATAPDPPPAPVPAPAAAAPPAPSAQAARSHPSVSVTCKGVMDVCGVIRTEIVQVLQRDGFPVAGNQAPADVALTVNVALVSETPTTQFGTPVITRTYAVDLTGVSRGTSVMMPEPHVFGYDTLFTNARLQENARLIAAGAASSLRGFSTSQSR